MKRVVVLASVIVVLAMVICPTGDQPNAEGGHAPGITMECDSLITEPFVTGTKFTRFTSVISWINDLIQLLVTTTYDSLYAEYPEYGDFRLQNYEIENFLREIADIHSNALGYSVSDLKLIYHYFGGGSDFPYLTLDGVPASERNHVDIYLYAGKQDCYTSSFRSSAYDTLEDVGYDYKDNSISVGGPCAPVPDWTFDPDCRYRGSYVSCAGQPGDSIWHEFSAPTFNHEFSHMCWQAQSDSLGHQVGDTPHNEIFAHTAGYLGGARFKAPRWNPDYDAGLIGGGDDIDDLDRRRNLWTLWGTYLLQHYRADEYDMEDDLVYRWVHELADGKRSFYSLARVLDDHEDAEDLGDDGDERLMMIIKNWTIANWLDNPQYDPLYGYDGEFHPHVDIGIFSDNVGISTNEWRVRSIPPEFIMGGEFDNTEVMFSGVWTDPPSGKTDSIRVFRNAADYLSFRSSGYYEDGHPHELRVTFDGEELPGNSKLFLTSITYASGADSLYKTAMGQTVISVDSVAYDPGSLVGDLVVDGFGDDVKGTALIVSLVETEFPSERLTLDEFDALNYSYEVVVATARLLTPSDTSVVWTTGSERDVEWECSPVQGDSVTILLSTDNGQTFPDTIATGVPNLESYTWTVGDYHSDSCRVRIEVKRESGYVLWGEGTESFTICSGVGADVRTEPEGMEALINGEAGYYYDQCSGQGYECFHISIEDQIYDNLIYRFDSWSDGGDRTHEVCPVTDTAFVATMDPDPIIHSGWPKSPPDTSESFVIPPVLADVDGDGLDEIILVSEDEYLHHFYVYDEDGTNINGYDTHLNGLPGLLAVPAAGDLDGDGDAEIVYAGEGLTAFDYDGVGLLSYGGFRSLRLRVWAGCR